MNKQNIVHVLLLSAWAKPPPCIWWDPSQKSYTALDVVSHVAWKLDDGRAKVCTNFGNMPYLDYCGKQVWQIYPWKKEQPGSTNRVQAGNFEVLIDNYPPGSLSHIGDGDQFQKIMEPDEHFTGRSVQACAILYETPAFLNLRLVYWG